MGYGRQKGEASMAKGRRDINALTDEELGDYIHALDVLRQRSAQNPDDETGYDFQAALHNDMFVGPCEHGSDLFFPWHRAHLHYFEQLLQAADPPRTQNVAIPYWDWIHAEATGKFPTAFSTDGLSEDDRNEQPVDLPGNTLTIVTNETSWGEFGGYPEGDPNGDYGRLERGPHNFMHPSFIGGKMANPATAAEDPIYFSFHCFIDLMWAEWQRRNGMPPATSLEHELRGFQTQPKHTVAEFQDTEELDYVYEYSDKLKEAFEIEVPAPPPTPELLATEPLEPVFPEGIAAELRRTDRLQFRLPSPAREALAPAREARATIVRLNGIKVPTGGSYVLRAYLHPADVEFAPDDPDFAARYFVDYVALWRAHAMPEGDDREAHAHHPTAMTARIDVTAKVGAPDSGGEQLLSLRYVPAAGPTGRRELRPELVDEVTLDDVVMEVYG
jgi:Common central domain of tyrosinase